MSLVGIESSHSVARNTATQTLFSVLQSNTIFNKMELRQFSTRKTILRSCCDKIEDNDWAVELLSWCRHVWTQSERLLCRPTLSLSISLFYLETNQEIDQLEGENKKFLPNCCWPAVSIELDGVARPGNSERQAMAGWRRAKYGRGVMSLSWMTEVVSSWG